MKKIGIVGGGQLGRMLADAAKKLDFEVIVLDPTPNSPASQVAHRQIVGDFKDAAAVRELAGQSDFITFEIESANADALRELLSEGHNINPSPETLFLIKDKFKQKEFLAKNNIPVADFVAVETKEDILNAAEQFGYPFLLKARLGAYDGRGNALVRNEEGIDEALLKLNNSWQNGGLYVEKFVPFVKELAVVVARGVNGDILPYPPVETVHQNNICHLVMAPARVPAEASEEAKNLASRIMTYLKGVGIYAIEMFLTEDGRVLVNEIAPRVHNSGHYSIEAHETSQFEQHIRAITGMPLGSIEMKAPAAVMINILGERSGPAELVGLDEAVALGDVGVHVYGKIETRPERKMGHITVVGDDLDSTIEKAKSARKLISI